MSIIKAKRKSKEKYYVNYAEDKADTRIKIDGIQKDDMKTVPDRKSERRFSYISRCIIIRDDSWECGLTTAPLKQGRFRNVFALHRDPQGLRRS